MFGLGFGEFLVLLLVAMIVLGPRELPRYLRKAGQFAGKMRRLAYEMREKSGIDEVLRTEGLDRDLAEIRKLTRGELASLTSVIREATNFTSSPSEASRASRGTADPYPSAPSLPERSWQRDAPVPFAPSRVVVDRVHEYPSEGADSYGALPDTAAVYRDGLARSPLADNPLCAHGQDVPPSPESPASDQVAEPGAPQSSPANADAAVSPNAPDPASPPAEVSDEAWS